MRFEERWRLRWNPRARRREAIVHVFVDGEQFALGCVASYGTTKALAFGGRLGETLARCTNCARDRARLEKRACNRPGVG